MLTLEQRAEGRRLLAIAQMLTRSEITETYAPLDDWLRLHSPELLADPAAVDVEAIKLEAVREFAEAMIADFTAEREIASRRASKHPMTRIESEARAEEWNEAILKLCEFAAARGVNLAEKP